MVSKFLPLTLTFALPASAVVVFSNDFEDNNLAPEVGNWSISGAPVTSQPAVSVSPDATLGTRLGLIDRETDWNTATGMPLGIIIPLGTIADPACSDITGSNTVTISFDVAARRTSGFAKTTFVDAFDANGNQIMRFVLGDSNAFGNGNVDRQRPGYHTSTTTTAFADDFYWGADGNPGNGFDVIRDAHFDLTIGGSGWDLNGVRQTGANDLTQTGLSTWDGSTFTNLAYFEISSPSVTNANNFGLYWDNITIDADVAPVPVDPAHVPEPSSTLLSAITLLTLLRRKR